MKAYLDIVRNVLNNGKWKSPVRKNEEGKFIPVDGGIRTLALPNQHFSHDMEQGFPLLTTKRMPFKVVAVELEGFLKGITSKKWYQDRKCKIWNEWANPRAVEAKLLERFESTELTPPDKGVAINCTWEQRKVVQAEVDDLGPIYGYQWRRFNQVYDEDDDGCVNRYDQLSSLLHTLTTNPHDRRMVVSAWNPVQISRMGLPPCHLMWIVTVIDGYLHLHWTQRSCDLMLGVPFNIASYGLLLSILCKEANLKPGNLSGMLCDCHIYENQIDAAREQIGREPKELPTLELAHKELAGMFTLDCHQPYYTLRWEANDAKILNYDPYEKLDFGAVAV